MLTAWLTNLMVYRRGVARQCNDPRSWGGVVLVFLARIGAWMSQAGK